MMPHSIYNFMIMVEGAEWVDTILVHHDHIVVATMKNSKGEVKERTTTNTELLFSEYSNEFPHEDLTVGFVGKLGGPELYINTQDNSEHHGPGKQPHHHLDGDADPCFARIIGGRDLFQEISKGSVAVIEHVKILGKLQSGKKTN
mmetsp:Transcript_19209/g.24206  ORF Transcript_19209/g.24206 Transcript_19209/m.24206 type:complete len:145 (+) Transcript_19209:3-437(+)